MIVINLTGALLLLYAPTPNLHCNATQRPSPPFAHFHPMPRRYPRTPVVPAGTPPGRTNSPSHTATTTHKNQTLDPPAALASIFREAKRAKDYNKRTRRPPTSTPRPLTPHPSPSTPTPPTPPPPSPPPRPPPPPPPPLAPLPHPGPPPAPPPPPPQSAPEAPGHKSQGQAVSPPRPPTHMHATRPPRPKKSLCGL